MEYTKLYKWISKVCKQRERKREIHAVEVYIYKFLSTTDQSIVMEVKSVVILKDKECLEKNMRNTSWSGVLWMAYITGCWYMDTSILKNELNTMSVFLIKLHTSIF